MSRRRVLQDFPADNHDHATCIDDALARAAEICERRGERFTKLRRQVLELVWESHQPIKAYDLLEALSASGRRAAPPTAYRALDFLQAAGLVHKLESINAYIGCSDPLRQHSGHFLICDSCGGVAEIVDPRIDDLIDAGGRRLGFKVRERKIEISGQCKACRTQDAGASA